MSRIAASHAPGDDGLPLCSRKTGAVVYGADPTCVYCRKALGLPVAHYNTRGRLLGIATVRSDAHAKLHAADVLRAELAHGPVMLADAVKRHALWKSVVYPMIRRAVTQGLADVTTTRVRVTKVDGHSRMQTQQVLTRLDPIDARTPKPRQEVLASLATSKSAMTAAHRLHALCPVVTTRREIFEVAAEAGIGVSLCTRAIAYARTHGMLTRTGCPATYTWRPTPPRATDLLPAKPKRIATPGSKPRKPRLSVDVEVLPACDRHDANGLPIAHPDPEPTPTPAPASIVSSETRRPFTTASARSTAALVSTAPVRRVDVAPLLDADLAAELRALMGAA